MMAQFVVRPVQITDAAALNEIYNPFILETAATFETTPYSLDDRRQWILDHQADPRHQVFVAEGTDGGLMGFASASAFDPRGAYETSVKTSVFVDLASHGPGGGKNPL